MLRLLSLLGLLLLPVSASADTGELYTLLELSPTASRLAAPSSSAGTSWKLLPAGKVLVLKGLTHELLLGGALGVAYGKDLLFRDAALGHADGSRPRGRLYEVFLGLSVGAVAASRYDTGYRIAPFVRAELGLTGRLFHNRTFLPANTSVQIAEPSLTEWTPYSHVALGAELRFADKWVAALGVGATRSFRGRVPWQVDASLVIGRIWW